MRQSWRHWRVSQHNQPMQQLALICPIAIPVIFWAVYHYHKDRHLPEPLGHLLLAFGLGMLAAGISQALYIGLEPLGLRFDAVALADTSVVALFSYSLLAIGLIEEVSKLLLFVLVILNPHNSLPIAALGIVAIWVWRLKLMQRLHKDASQTR